MIAVAAKLLISIITTFGWVTINANNEYDTGTIVSIVDGDTVDLSVELGCDIHHKIRVRL